MIIDSIPKISHIPEDIKILALKAVEELDFDKIPETQFLEIEKILKYNPLTNIQ